ncbi:MAG: hypothetical protein JNL22_15465 [Bacteroidales bacterium]|nr:hypothetical protein [Bacteroidales bacterium]
MKAAKFFIFLMTGIALVSGCGKPNEPEIPVTPDISGNYKIVGRVATSGFAQDLVLDNGLLYIAQGEGGLCIVDVSTPTNPEVVSQLTEDVRGYSTRIIQQDSVVYLAAGSFGLTVVNVANPEQPFVTVSNLNMKPAKNLHIFGKYLLSAISEQGVKIAEISYPEQPDIRGSVSTKGYATGITTNADTSLLFVSCGEMGLSMFDITDFQDGYPSTIPAGWCDTPGYAEAVVLDESRSLAFMGCGYAGLQILSYADTSNVHIVGNYAADGYAKDLILDNNKIYLATQKGGLLILDVSVPSKPVLLGTVETSYAQGITSDNNYIYLADEEEGLIVIAKP